MIANLWNALSRATGRGGVEENQDNTYQQQQQRSPGRKWARDGHEESPPGDAADSFNSLCSPDPKGQNGSVLINPNSNNTNTIDSSNQRRGILRGDGSGDNNNVAERHLSFHQGVADTTQTYQTPRRVHFGNPSTTTTTSTIAAATQDTSSSSSTGEVVGGESRNWRDTMVSYSAPRRGVPPKLTPSATPNSSTLNSPNTSSSRTFFPPMSGQSTRSTLGVGSGRSYGGGDVQPSSDRLQSVRELQRSKWDAALKGGGGQKAGGGAMTHTSYMPTYQSSQQTLLCGGSGGSTSTDSLLRMLSGAQPTSSSLKSPSFTDPTVSIFPQRRPSAASSSDDDDDELRGYEDNLDYLVAASTAALSRGFNVGSYSYAATTRDEDLHSLSNAVVELREARAAHDSNMVQQRGQGRPCGIGCTSITGATTTPADADSAYCVYPALHPTHISEALAQEVATGQRLSTTFAPSSLNTKLKASLLAKKNNGEGSDSEVVEVADDDATSKDVLLLNSLQAATRELSRNEVSRRTNSNISSTWTSVYEMVRKLVVRSAVSACPPPEGVIQHIMSKTPAAVPVKFTAEDEARLDTLQKYPQRGEYVIRDMDLGYEIARYQLESCFGNEKLNDQVMNYYCSLVAKQGDGVIMLLSSFYSKLVSEIDAGATEFPNAYRWTRNRDIFGCRLVLVVINQHDHWTLCVVHNENKTITYYDSCGGPGSSVMANIAAFFDYAYDTKINGGKKSEKGSAFTSSYARCSPRREGVPQQVGVVDCGVFALQFCLYAALERPFNFRQEDIPYLRRLIPLELLSGRMMARL